MSARLLPMTEHLRDYLLSVSLRETDAQRELREATLSVRGALMQISPEQGQFMALLVELTGARRVIEVGTYTGYSALSVAQALPADGKLICCDISEEWTSIGRPYWEKAGVAGRIDLRIGPAMATLDDLLGQGFGGDFDMAFIDADKANYDGYYERCLLLLRPGGLILIDNVLWSGAVADPAKVDADTQALRVLNRKLHGDPRVSLSMLPIGDGLTLARKRA
ncbi:putative O-methyltransferase YrrM [Stella humosa]|uniref:Putative O-methyltransferase YrrM n=1 Tax=Stella humosa TaxID=94 RepID=A0A3N1KYL3_9PROT|nr:class I SAM-dependent methyltransferase [Stella humosa]ROP83889.1 putative O-methyltransferase YrrM [Stella humosa]BBK32849.1 O-methyltransferase [Stella humosa]